jgi:hypothetical protein
METSPSSPRTIRPAFTTDISIRVNGNLTIVAFTVVELTWFTSIKPSPLARGKSAS